MENKVVYRHIRLDKNEPFYIGIGNYERAYRKDNYRSNLWNKIVNKSDYIIEILFENISFDYAKEKEIELIKLYGRINNNTGILCNLTDGGEGSSGVIVSKKTRCKISKINKGKKLSEETKQKISKANKGRSMSNETKLKLSNSLKGKLSKISKQVIHLKTGIFYDSLRSGCYFHNINYKPEFARMKKNINFSFKFI